MTGALAALDHIELVEGEGDGGGQGLDLKMIVIIKVVMVIRVTDLPGLSAHPRAWGCTCRREEL